MLPQGRFYDILTTYRAATLTLRFYHESNRENRGFVFLFDNRAKSDWLIFKKSPTENRSPTSTLLPTFAIDHKIFLFLVKHYYKSPFERIKSYV